MKDKETTGNQTKAGEKEGDEISCWFAKLTEGALKNALFIKN